jgi:hypothetical protein
MISSLSQIGIYDLFPFANWISRDLHKCKMGNRIQATMFSSVLLSRAQKPDSYVQLETNVFGRSILNTNKQWFAHSSLAWEKKMSNSNISTSSHTSPCKMGTSKKENSIKHMVANTDMPTYMPLLHKFVLLCTRKTLKLHMIRKIRLEFMSLSAARIILKDTTMHKMYSHAYKL